MGVLQNHSRNFCYRMRGLFDSLINFTDLEPLASELDLVVDTAQELETVIVKKPD